MVRRSLQRTQQLRLLTIPNHTPGEINRPALRYFGGKWELGRWIIQHFPNHQTYVEPYGGAFSVGLQKQPAQIEIYNDINDDTVNFFQQLRTHPKELIQAIAQSPRTRETFEESTKFADNSIERARRYYLFCQLSFSGGGTRWSSGTSEARLALPSIVDDSHLWAIANRLETVQIESLDALDCIRKYDSPETLFYIDPPYVQSVRGSKDKRHKDLRKSKPRRQYKHELDDDQHRELAELLHCIQGNAIVSGYECELYSELFQGWNSVRKVTVATNGNQKVECLWTKPPTRKLIPVCEIANVKPNGWIVTKDGLHLNPLHYGMAELAGHGKDPTRLQPSLIEGFSDLIPVETEPKRVLGGDHSDRSRHSCGWIEFHQVKRDRKKKGKDGKTEIWTCKQAWLHWEEPGGKKRSKYVPKAKLADVEHFVYDLRKPIQETLKLLWQK